MHTFYPFDRCENRDRDKVMAIGHTTCKLPNKCQPRLVWPQSLWSWTLLKTWCGAGRQPQKTRLMESWLIWVWGLRYISNFPGYLLWANEPIWSFWEWLWCHYLTAKAKSKAYRNEYVGWEHVVMGMSHWALTTSVLCRFPPLCRYYFWSV